MKVVIMCAGDSKRWGNHLGTPKQLVEVDGEKILHRTIRLLKENGVEDITVTVPEIGFFGELGVNQEVGKSVCELDKFLNAEADLYLWGDTYFTEEAIKRILQDDSLPMWYGDIEELFALKPTPRLMRLAKDLRKMRNSMRRCASWELYRLFNGILFDEHKITKHFIFINDETTDFDYPSDLEHFMYKRQITECDICHSKNQVRHLHKLDKDDKTFYVCPECWSKK